MFKKIALLLAAVAFISFSVVSCNRPDPEPEPPVNPADFILSVPIVQNWIFEANQ